MSSSPRTLSSFAPFPPRLTSVRLDSYFVSPLPWSRGFEFEFESYDRDAEVGPSLSLLLHRFSRGSRDDAVRLPSFLLLLRCRRGSRELSPEQRSLLLPPLLLPLLLLLLL